MKKLMGLSLFGVFAGLLLSGCSLMPVHDVSVSKDLRESPVTTIFIATPQTNPKMKRQQPDWDFQEMLPGNLATVQETITNALADALKSKVTVLTPTNPMTDAWLKKIGVELAKSRIPLNVDPLPSDQEAHEAVLIVGVRFYGTWDGQTKLQTIFTGSKQFRFGKTHWYHECHLNMILVQPKTGHVLMAVEHREQIKLVGPGTDPRIGKDPAVLDKVLRDTVQVLADALPKKN
ncbi:MAG: hypothetical protein Q8P76_02070 [bacterium]|nr:hypothetical protein [bacterium]